MQTFRRLMRSGIGTMCALLFAATLVHPASVRAAEDAPAPEKLSPEKLSPEKLKAEIERLQKEIAALRDSPDAPPEWKEFVQIQKKLRELDEEKMQAEKPLRQRWAALYNGEPTRKWNDRIGQLHQRLHVLQIDDRDRAFEDGRRLYEARHRELEKRGPTDTPNLRRLGLDVLSYPRIDGSTSTVPLSILIASRCFDMPCAWFGPARQYRRWDRYYGGGLEGSPDWATQYPEAEFDLAEFIIHAKPAKPAQARLAAIINDLIVATPSTHEAYVRLIEGRSEFGLLARGPSPAELDLARQKGVELATAPCALDALVFMVNDESGVRNLTTEQIRGIYSRKITRWNEVGGSDAAITPYQRAEQSGSQELMRTLVMKELPFVKPAGRATAPELIQSAMGTPFVRLHEDRNGLAYSVYYYERYMAGSARTRTIAVDGIEPTDDSLRTRKYPFVSEVLIVTRKDLDPNAPAARLRDWLLTSEGQTVVRESGYVPLPAK